MGNLDFFAELKQTTMAYCESLGLPSDTYTRPLSDAELNGVPLSAEEVETHRLIAAGVPAEAADQYADSLRADDLRIRQILVHQQRTIRLRNRNYAPGRFANFAKRERFIRSQIGA